ncbi:hypothetical protein [Streptomyces pseudogriseolus]|uniref:hypothetical protein n=1 Tax=Streptomyces pseudogriseolus TaxID=36817 RepID=UPI001CE2AEE4|nr:hypothetical protein [Streptomyces pseudogriseolus]
MRKFQKAAVVAAMLGSVGFLGAGVSYAGDEPNVEVTNNQANLCGNESTEGNVVNLSRNPIGIIQVPIASPQDLSHSTACSNVFGG